MKKKIKIRTPAGARPLSKACLSPEGGGGGAHLE